MIYLANLTIGTTYQIQIWMPNWNAPYQASFSSATPTWYGGGNPPLHGSAADQSPLLNAGYNSTAPQYVIGQFTADATTENLYNIGEPQYAIVAAVAVSTVPEPSTWAMLLGGVVMLAVLRRRRMARG